MKGDQLKKTLKQGKIANQYLLIADEAIFIENAIEAIKEVLDINESFDYDTFSASETPIEEIIQKLYLNPFGSSKRLLVVKHLEELKNNALSSFARAINQTRSQNCLVMTRVVNKDARRSTRGKKKINELFSQAVPVFFSTDKSIIHTWISAKTERDNIKLTPSLMRYLEEEFNNDITGLKNEFDKIENYLYEADTLNTTNIKDLAKGLCNFNQYQVANAFVNGKKDILELFEELRPYLKHPAEIVDALVRSFVSHVQRSKKAKTSMVKLTNEITDIDKRVKRSSTFSYLMLELFFLRNENFFRKGARYGR